MSSSLRFWSSETRSDEWIPGASTWRAVQEVKRIPTELRKVKEVVLARTATVAVVGAFALFLPMLLDGSQTSLASAILLYAMVGVSMVLLTGWSGNVSLGHWAFVGVGALLAGRIATTWTDPPGLFVTLLISGSAGAVVAMVIGLPALRIRGLFLGATTLAFAIVAYSWFFQWDIFAPEGAIQRPPFLGRIDLTTELQYYYVCLVALILTAVAATNLRRTRTGRNFIALRDNEQQAQAYGIRPIRSKLTAFALSGFFAAAAGALYAFHQQAIRAERFPPEVSLQMFSMVVIGGMGSISGAVLGAVYFRGVQYFLPSEFQLLATGMGLLILLRIFPGGLGQIVFGWRDRFLRWVAARNNIHVPSLVADRRVDSGAVPVGVQAPAGVDGAYVEEVLEEVNK